MIRFLELRNMLMEQHGWNRRVATIAARIYLGVDTPEILATTNLGDYGRTVISESEFRNICRWR